MSSVTPRGSKLGVVYVPHPDGSIEVVHWKPYPDIPQGRQAFLDVVHFAARRNPARDLWYLLDAHDPAEQPARAN